ncbi:hypothetical protein [Neisseria elongata]|uniref:hypothetical protein n=1 Tax=Neisseria elongata TaxID=495 RepID=UPI000E0CD27C|nr:hypothetical protein [Neisseria elongata]
MMSRKKLFSVNTKPDNPFFQNTDRKPVMTDLSHLSREEQKLLADVALLFLKTTANNPTMQC